MKIIFVPPIMYLSTPDVQPHMGLASLQTVLDKDRYSTEIISLNPTLTGAYESYRVQKHQAISEDFYRESVERLLQGNPDLVGFSTVGASYPTTLVLVNKLKEECPDLTVVLGGIQATLCGEETMRHFPAVDYIIAGEAEISFPIFLHHLQDGTPFPPATGVYYRTVEGDVAYTGDAPLIENLDTLPMMDYGKVDMAALSEISIDVGRGCPFQCYYCCTNNYWRRTFRLRSAENIVNEIEHLYRTYGKQYFAFNHDLLTCNRRVFRQLLKTLKERNLPIHWRGSSRIDTLDEDLLKEMAETGCYQVFMGIESGSPRMQRIMKKHLDPQRVIALLDAANQFNIRCTTSFICGMPEETFDDLIQTVDLVYECIARNTSTQVHLLAPFQGTEVFDLYHDHLRFDGQSSNVGSFVINNQLEEELIERYPEIFCNFYYIENPHISREVLRNVEHLPKALPYFWRTLGVLRYTHHVELGEIVLAYLQQSIPLNALPAFIQSWVENVSPPSQLLKEVFAFEMALFATRIDEPYPDTYPSVEPEAYLHRKDGSQLYSLSFNLTDVEESIRQHHPSLISATEPLMALMSATCHNTLPHYNLIVAHSSVVSIYQRADGTLRVQDLIDEAIQELQGTMPAEQVRDSIIQLLRKLIHLRTITLEKH